MRSPALLTEQAQGIKQINQSLGQVEQVTQSNTANAEESASAAQELTSQAAHLKEMLRRFKLTEQHGSANKPIEKAANVHVVDERWAAAGSEKSTDSSGKTIILDDDEFGKF